MFGDPGDHGIVTGPGQGRLALIVKRLALFGEGGARGAGHHGPAVDLDKRA